MTVRKRDIQRGCVHMCVCACEWVCAYVRARVCVEVSLILTSNVHLPNEKLDEYKCLQ